MLRRLPFSLLFLALLAIAPASSSRPLVHDMAARNAQVLNAYTPKQIQQAYDIAPLYGQDVDGSGETVALIEIDAYHPDDIAQFDRAYGLPAPHIRILYPDYVTLTPKRGPETTMDVEWLHALAPGANIQVYYLDNDLPQRENWWQFADAVRSAVQHGAKTISVSVGACNAGKGAPQMRAALLGAMRKGVSIFVSSGDSGDRPGTVEQCGSKIGVGYPTADSSVVAVGGTTLRLSPTGDIARETAWSLSGGGNALAERRPAWQTNVPRGRGRWAPDVAFLGNPQTGVAAYYRGRLRTAAGTSLGAPCWAAIWALLRQSARMDGFNLPAANALLYSIGTDSNLYSAGFHDVIWGNNGKYRAHKGWDAVTGWGTPDVFDLAQLVEFAAAE